MSEDKKRVIDRIKVAADNGDADSQFILASMFDIFVEYRNEEEAFKYYKLAANNGIAEAQYRLGDIYYYNSVFHFIVNINKEEAFKYYKLAADNGYAPAQYKIGKIYEDGLQTYDPKTGKTNVVVAENSTSALKYYKLAALGGIKEALIRVLEICVSKKKYEVFEKFYMIASNSEDEHTRISANNLSREIKRKKQIEINNNYNIKELS